ncbi:unnamed protein product [Allacma fusca]|uniref:GRIP domain-containing protein n=1 Tax=Allacma fusca TaxID=39272 RepID=A0A8J2PGI7_9HEXA|nr:unnamed protein product [Allacma fusca]
MGFRVFLFMTGTCDFPGIVHIGNYVIRHFGILFEGWSNLDAAATVRWFQEKETEISKLNSQIKEVGSNLDGKVDRYLLKNLIVGYFSTPADKRKEVLRVIATVLDFNREDRQKTGLEGSSMWPFKLDSFTAEKQSLSEAFIKFLENESQPKVQVRIPSEEITRRSSRSSSSSAAPGESPIPRSNSPSASAATASTSLIGGVPEISMSLPVLNQADRSNSILKDVLNPKP